MAAPVSTFSQPPIIEEEKLTPLPDKSKVEDFILAIPEM